MGQKPSLRLVENKRDALRAATPKSLTPIEGDFWTGERSAMHSLHYVVPYPNSFKPELVDFCIRRYSEKNGVVFDPFCGRGTTALQAALLGRVSWACDANPLAVKITSAKLNPSGLHEVVLRLNQIELNRPVSVVGYQENFSPFFHVDTYRELVNLRNFLRQNNEITNKFIELLALSRLHGHSLGFFSGYSFPHLSLLPEAQRKLNQKRREVPQYRAVIPRLIRKAAEALQDGFTTEFLNLNGVSKVELADARSLQGFPSDSVDLIVTAPPLLKESTPKESNFVTEHWLEFWFLGMSRREYSDRVVLPQTKDEWRLFIRLVLRQMLRVLKPYSFALLDIREMESSEGDVFFDKILIDEVEQVITPEKCLVLEEVLINHKQPFLSSHHPVRANESLSKERSRSSLVTHRLIALKCLPRSSRFSRSR